MLKNTAPFADLTLFEHPRLLVFNPRGRDAPQAFPDAAGDPHSSSAGPHAPVNFHAYAACLRGEFLTDLRAVLRRNTPTPAPVLLLLRRDLAGGLNCLRALRSAGHPVAVSFKETGAFQVAAQLAKPGALRLFREIVSEAPGCLAPTPWLADFFRDAGARGVVEFLPTPYPVDDPRWDFSARETDAPSGTLVGTREFATLSRQHLAAVLSASRLGAETGEPVTVINSEGRHGARRLEALGFSLSPGANNLRHYVNGPLPYADYLRLIARHQLVFQLDRSAVPGQVAGDALLCRVPCVGGDGAVEILASPDLAGHNKTAAELAGLAAMLLRDVAARQRAIADAQARAAALLSFSAVAPRLADFFRKIAATI
ncbi:MAG: hypothetical protein JO117_09330 [Verrucomicrobia bacterium]|nr:hypothetical protein [Verrucomicrobiota bacterium]